MKRGLIIEKYDDDPGEKPKTGRIYGFRQGVNITKEDTKEWLVWVRLLDPDEDNRVVARARCSDEDAAEWFVEFVQNDMGYVDNEIKEGRFGEWKPFIG